MAAPAMGQRRDHVQKPLLFGSFPFAIAVLSITPTGAKKEDAIAKRKVLKTRRLTHSRSSIGSQIREVRKGVLLSDWSGKNLL